MIPENLPAYVTKAQGIIADNTKQIVMGIVQAMIAGGTKMPVAQLAEKHTIENLQDELSTMDEKAKRVFNKLFETTQEMIKENSQGIIGILLMTIGDDEKGGNFLKSFVCRQTEEAYGKLKSEAPQALEEARIWQ